MTLSSSQVKKIMSQGVEPQITQMGLRLTLSQLRANYQNMPTQASLEMCTQELNAYLGKYASIMEEDINKLVNL